MRYRIKGTEIRTENAAKPSTQRSKVVVAYLESRPRVTAALDFGCGKLRYGDLVSRLGKRVIFADSQVQLSRRQRIRGRTGTVTKLAPILFPNSFAVPIETIGTHTQQYDLVTCINVLSAIPDAQALEDALQNIYRLTKTGGTAVFVHQHRNTYFNTFRVGTRHLFGFVFDGKRGSSYYGVMTKERVQTLLTKNGFRIIKAWCSGEINFVEACPSRSRKPTTRVSHSRPQPVSGVTADTRGPLCQCDLRHLPSIVYSPR
jgi:2-polyprenyl-3-methyl-5-hydroxy-6-metoxy-1,4-benzoquinol methylase